MNDYHEPNPLIGFLKARLQGASVTEAMQVMSDLCDEPESQPDDGSRHENLKADVQRTISISLHKGRTLKDLRQMTTEDRLLTLAALLKPEHHQLLDTENGRELALSHFDQGIDRAEQAIRAMED